MAKSSGWRMTDGDRRSTVDDRRRGGAGDGRGSRGDGLGWRLTRIQTRVKNDSWRTKNKKPETPWRGIRTIPACGLRTTTITSVLSIALWIDTLQSPLSDRIISTFCVTFRVHVIIGLVCSCTILSYTCDVSLITSISEYLSCKCLCFVLFSPSVEVCSFF